MTQDYVLLLTSVYKQKGLSQFLHRHLDNFIMTGSFSSVYKYQDSGSGQIRNSGTNYLSPGLAKIAPWWLVRRDSFLAKAPGLVMAVCATNAFCSYTLAVGCNKFFSSSARLHQDWFTARA
jgi:hypothetical protein